MPAFDTYDKAKVKKSVPKAVDTAAEAREMYDGDHWRGGLGWVGPTPRQGNAEMAFIMAEISRQFVSRNVLKIVVDRHVSALLASEPSWMFVPKRTLADDQEPTDEETTQSQLAEEIISEWWDKTRALEHLKSAVVNALLTKRGAIRIFVPPGKVGTLVQEDGTTVPGIAKQDIKEGISKLLFVEDSEAFVVTDTDTMEKASVLIKKDDTGKETVEFSFVQEDGTTLVRTWSREVAPMDIPLPLGGKLIVKEIEREPLVTRQMLAAQRSLNMSLTMLDRNAIQGGFLERVVLNAEPPGDWVDDTSAPNGKKFITKPMQMGAGRTTFIGSRVVESTESSDPPIVLPVDIRWKDPIKPDTFIATAQEHRHGIYEEASQLHALIAGDAMASAVSRVQARADFLDSLSKTKPQVDEAMRWILEIALDHACFFAGVNRETKFGLVRAACDIQMSSGPLTPEERQAVMDMVEKEMLSLETAMQLLGVEDVDAERSRLSQEVANPNPARKLKMMETYVKAGYAFAPDQLGDLDKELGVEERDMTIVLADQAASQDMQRESLRQQKNATDPANEDPNANPDANVS